MSKLSNQAPCCSKFNKLTRQIEKNHRETSCCLLTERKKPSLFKIMKLKDIVESYQHRWCFKHVTHKLGTFEESVFAH